MRLLWRGTVRNLWRSGTKIAEYLYSPGILAYELGIILSTGEFHHAPSPPPTTQLCCATQPRPLHPTLTYLVPAANIRRALSSSFLLIDTLNPIKYHLLWTSAPKLFHIFHLKVSSSLQVKSYHYFPIPVSHYPSKLGTALFG
jgi:hypothetical protein